MKFVAALDDTGRSLSPNYEAKYNKLLNCFLKDRELEVARGSKVEPPPVLLPYFERNIELNHQVENYDPSRADAYYQPGMHGHMNNAGFEDVRENFAQHVSDLQGLEKRLSLNNVMMTCGAAGVLNVIHYLRLFL